MMIRNFQKILSILLLLFGMLEAGLHSSPSCHAGIMKLFHWCEQSECRDNCTCISTNRVCKQICGQPVCGVMTCSSPNTCFQSVLLNQDNHLPQINKILSHSPIAQQDCSQGNCRMLKAIRYYSTYTKTFQSCSEGKCDHVYSSGDHAKQFCGNCNKMTCTGSHAENCTQLCVLGHCKQMTCNAKHCKQLCAHQSTCNMTCGANTDICEQTCSHGSTCILNCNSDVCNQTCSDKKRCTVRNLQTTTLSPTITAKETTSTSTPPVKTSTQNYTTTRIDNEIVSVEIEHPNDVSLSYVSTSPRLFKLTFNAACMYLFALGVLYLYV